MNDISTENQPRHYRHHKMVRFNASGERKVRDLYVPDEETTERHDAMLRFFYSTRLLEPVLQDGRMVAPGGMPGATILDNVIPHQYSRTFYALDLKDAFPSVDLPTLKQKVEASPGVRSAGYIQHFIDDYVSAPNIEGLPVGAPCSPYLFNVYCRDMDMALRDVCDEQDLVYTRWLDDITISSPAADGVLGELTRRKIRDIIQQTPGMAINHKKSKLHRRLTKPVTITGVSLYPDGRLQPGPSVMTSIVGAFDEIEADIYNPDTPIGEPHLARLNGYHGALVGMSREPHSEIMRELFERYHTLARLAHAAIAMDREPPYVTDVERKKFVKSILKMIEVQEYRQKKAAMYRQLDDEGI